MRIIAVLLVALPLLAREPLTVGNVTAQPGQKVAGCIEVATGSDDGHHRIDAKGGPVLALIAGSRSSIGEMLYVVATPPVSEGHQLAMIAALSR